MPFITSVFAREILDSRGYPTVEAEVRADGFFGRAAAPSGASTGTLEALELRDGGQRYGGKGVLRAVSNVNGQIAQALEGTEVLEQNVVDGKLVSLDGTSNKGRLGANATTAVSLACAQCAANSKGIGLYALLGGNVLPLPFMNVLNGGKHAGNGVAVQEFMIVPHGFSKFSEGLQAGSEIYHTLGKKIAIKYGKAATGVGDEGGYAPAVKKTEDALELLVASIEDCGYGKKVSLAIDAAASSFYEGKKYSVDGKKLDAGKLLEKYVSLTKKYPIVSIEDPFFEQDFENFAHLRKKLAGKVQIVSDDLTVTNTKIISRAIKEKCMSALLLKVNQIGTLSEALEAAAMCRKAGLGVMVSHRSGETEDTAIADIAVGIGCGQIKTGSLARSERVAKYNRLLRIEEELGNKGKFAGTSGLKF
ncbi:Enolase [Candidatus Anstonella stagnisolia]|nr:Enolase [Candidatus Anstonella stagnisolia]